MFGPSFRVNLCPDQLLNSYCSFIARSQAVDLEYARWLENRDREQVMRAEQLERDRIDAVRDRQRQDLSDERLRERIRQRLDAGPPTYLPFGPFGGQGGQSMLNTPTPGHIANLPSMDFYQAEVLRYFGPNIE